MVSEHIEKAMRKIEGWWHGELVDDRTCIAFTNPSLTATSRNWQTRKNAQAIFSYFNELWPHPAQRPVDIEKFVEAEINLVHSLSYFGEAIPKIPHLYGLRGTPLMMPAFLGADLEFLEDTILVKPFIDNWKTVELRIQPLSLWHEMSLRMVELATQKNKGEFLVDLPDFGDVFTCLFLMRGPMIFQDLGFEPKLLEVRDRFIDLWIEAYESFWKITSQKFPGSCHWLIWAPGKSYACQCDASCMAVTAFKKEVAPILLKRIVEDFIVPEMEKLGEYLDYIIWHLDGEEETRFLHVLLELPQIKAVQWRPKQGSPANPKWIPLLKKIQKTGKSVWVAAENEKEVETLIASLSPERLYINGGFTGKTEKEARSFLKKVERLTRQRVRQRSF